MDYKSLMGFSKKKKVVKETPKPKVNKVLESIKEEFNIKEVGASAEYRKHTKNIEKSYRRYLDQVEDFESLLVKKGLKPAAKEIHKKYAKNVLGFQVWLRGKLERLL